MHHLPSERRPSEYRPFLEPHPVGPTIILPSTDQPLPTTEDVTGMTMMPPMPATSTMPPPSFMAAAPSMAAMSTMTPMTSMPPAWTMGPPNHITTGPPPAPLSTKPNMRKRAATGMPATTHTPTTTIGPAMANVVDPHHPKSAGAYYPPTKRIKREPIDNPRKPSWAISSEPDDASIISLPRPPMEMGINPPPPLPAETQNQPTGGHANSDPSSSSSSSSYSSPSEVAAAPRQPSLMQNPPAPIIPAPLEPFPEAGTIMNFPLPQIDHQGQRPAAADGYFSSLEDDLLYQTQEPYEIEMAYRAALRVRERVDWDCRRLGLRLRYLRRCQARMAECHRAARECEWQRSDFCEQADG